MPRKASPRLLAIRRALRAGEPVRDIADRLGVTTGYVYSVRSRLPERQMPVAPPPPPPPSPPPPKPSLWDRLLSSFRG